MDKKKTIPSVSAPSFFKHSIASLTMLRVQCEIRGVISGRTNEAEKCDSILPFGPSFRFSPYSLPATIDEGWNLNWYKKLITSFCCFAFAQPQPRWTPLPGECRQISTLTEWKESNDPGAIHFIHFTLCGCSFHNVSVAVTHSRLLGTTVRNASYDNLQSQDEIISLCICVPPSVAYTK